jgi:hypothetical protein
MKSSHLFIFQNSFQNVTTGGIAVLADTRNVIYKFGVALLTADHSSALIQNEISF